jgi:carbon-monoxide dehydrogenase small subunit
MTEITLTVNGQRIAARVEPRTHLADFLREEQRLTGTHLGCEQGVCGACTILLDGAPARACLTFAAACNGAEIRTVEGFGNDLLMARLREAFSAEHALQCGFCTPGMLISAYDVVRRLPGADEPRIRRELSGNLCRCTGYMGIIAAVTRVLAEATAEERAAAVAPRPIAAAGAGDEPDIPSVAAPSLRSASPRRPSWWARLKARFGVGE